MIALHGSQLHFCGLFDTFPCITLSRRTWISFASVRRRISVAFKSRDFKVGQARVELVGKFVHHKHQGPDEIAL